MTREGSLLITAALACAVSCGESTPQGGGAGTTSRSTISTSTATGTGGATSTSSTTTNLGGAVGACTSCDGACADTANDPRHCGACGHACGADQTCDHGTCATPTCLNQGLICPTDHLCCGDQCCPSWKMCCNVPGSAAPTCVLLDAGACPTTCAGCL
jgi:hypothetical protein